ncbi:MAG: hypothetical protein KJ050_10615 [Candidatus Omnitrophica bacterium]|nr:hypothetical protein [Candidatus Omnitrophota bacterium]
MKYTAILLIAFAIAIPGVAYSGCNTEDPIVVGSNRITMRLAPCGPAPIAPDYFEVLVRAAENETSFNLPAVPVFGTNDVKINLFTEYLLQPGDNEINFRAMEKSGKYRPGGVESVILKYVEPTPTPTPEPTPTPTPESLGRYTLTEIEVQP